MMRSIAMTLRNLLGAGETAGRRALVIGTGTPEEVDIAVAHLRARHPRASIDILADPWITRPGVMAFELAGVDGGTHRSWRHLRNHPYDVVAVLWTGHPVTTPRWKLLGAFSLLATRVWVFTEYGAPFALSRSELRTLARHAARRWRQASSTDEPLSGAVKLALTAPLLLIWSALLRAAHLLRRRPRR